MGSTIVTAALVATLPRHTTTNRDLIQQLTQKVTYEKLGCAYTENAPIPDDLIEEGSDAAEKIDEGSTQSIPIDLANELAEHILELLSDLEGALENSREVNCHQLPDGTLVYLTGGETWGDSPGECDVFWNYTSLEYLYGTELFDELHLWPLSMSPLKAIGTPKDMIAQACMASEDERIRLTAACDEFLPLNAEQIDALAHDQDPSIRAAMARRIADTLQR